MERRAVTSAPDWLPIWALPNLVVEEPIETTFVALLPVEDERVSRACERFVGLERFLRTFKDEFGGEIDPSLIMIRIDAPDRVRTVSAVASFRDAVCMSVLPLSHARKLKEGFSLDIQFSDAFDAYPWTLRDEADTHIIARTSGVLALHDVTELQAQCAPALGARRLARHDVDVVLLGALLDRWNALYVGADDPMNLRLFRSLDMARAASRMPGGTDATIFDRGRSIGLWVSAFETLAYDGGADICRVVDLLRRAPWYHRELRDADRTLRARKLLTNIDGDVYRRLLHLRNQFLHGDPVTPDDLGLPMGREALRFAAPLFRLALTAYLDLRFGEPPFDALADHVEYGPYLARFARHHSAQETIEDAILLADTPPPHHLT